MARASGSGVLGGIDEAGRGPVMGPLVVAGVAVADPAPLAEMGCRDSKLLTPYVRESLARRIRLLPGVVVEVRAIEAATLDAERQSRSLNDIEADRFADIARVLAGTGARTIHVDAADTDAARFGRKVAAGLPPGVQVASEHKADERHVVVGAASIIAKVERDAAIATLARRLERKLAMPLGSGYPGDPVTLAFLRAYVARFADLPEGTRRSWATVKDMLAPKPARLDEFA